jgi:UDP-N-acetyl-2-amino-2-deoxyglucuronate dehydrogenase
MEEMIKVGLIGAGRIARAHLNALRSLQGKFSVSGIYDVDKNKSLRLSKDFDLNVFSSLGQAIDKSDLLSITVPDGFHYKLTKQALVTGKPVLTEKPAALTEANLEDLLDISERSSVPIFVSLQKRLFKTFKNVHRAVNEGEIGILIASSLQQIWYRDENYFKNNWHGNKLSDGGLILNQSIHNLDLLNLISGGISKVSAFGGNLINKAIETEDIVVATFETRKNSVGDILLTISSGPRNYGELFEFIGSKGKIFIGTGNFTQLTSKNFVQFEEELKTSTLSGYGHTLVYKEIYNRIAKNTESEIELKNVYDSHKLAFAIRNAIIENRKITIGGKNGDS